MIVNGEILHGEFDENRQEFSLQQVKNFTTQTTIKENQLKSLYDYLVKHQEAGKSHVMTLYDQLPVQLSNEELALVVQDIKKIHELYQ